MKLMQHKDLKELIDFEGTPCVSIYLPTASKGRETKEGSIRFKNLLRECGRRLQENPEMGRRLEAEFARAQALTEDAPFWLHQNQGLAVFMAPSFFRYYRVGVRFRQQLHINRRFFIKPMVPLFSYERRFYLLAVNLKQVRFFEIQQDSIFERDLPEAPRTIDEWMQYENLGPQMGQPRAMASNTVGGVSSTFHGHGNIADNKIRKKMVEQYLKWVVRRFEELLRNDSTRVILAADPYVSSVIRDARPQFTLIEEPILENPSRLKAEELLERAQKVIRPYMNRQIRGFVRMVSDMLGTYRTAVETGDVLTAARLGKVQILLVDPQESLWGRYSQDDQQIEVHGSRREGDEDLSEEAVEQTLLHDGMICSLPKQAIPDQRVMAALLRY